MEIRTKRTNLIYDNFERFKHEIFLDTYDELMKSPIICVQKSVVKLGSNEIHHIIKYHQKIILNALYFKDKNIFLDYHIWLYRVYYHRDIDLDFFKYMLEFFQHNCAKYIEMKINLNIVNYYKYIIDQHEDLKKEADKRKVIFDHIEESISFANLLINSDKQKAYEICKENSSTIEKFLEFYNGVVSNAMKHIGFMWEIGEVSVAKEHISSNTLNDVMTKILDEFPKKDEKQKHIFLSSAPHEHHGQGVSVASKVYEKLGYKVTNLGTNIPIKDMQKAIIEFKPDLIILAATLQTSLLDVAYLIDEIMKDKQIFIKPFKIAIAGSAFEKVVHPAKVFDADFYMNKLEDISKYI